MKKMHKGGAVLAAALISLWANGKPVLATNQGQKCPPVGSGFTYPTPDTGCVNQNPGWYEWNNMDNPVYVCTTSGATANDYCPLPDPNYGYNGVVIGYEWGNIVGSCADHDATEPSYYYVEYRRSTCRQANRKWPCPDPPESTTITCSQGSPSGP